MTVVELMIISKFLIFITNVKDSNSFNKIDSKSDRNGKDRIRKLVDSSDDENDVEGDETRK